MGRCDLHRSLVWRRRWRFSWLRRSRPRAPAAATRRRPARATPTAARAWTRRRCPATPGGWTWVDVPGMGCDDGSATGVAVNPAGRGGGGALFIYFMGGGACWDASTCFVLNTAVHGPFGQAQWDGTGAPVGRARARSRARHQPVPRRELRLRPLLHRRSARRQQRRDLRRAGPAHVRARRPPQRRGAAAAPARHLAGARARRDRGQQRRRLRRDAELRPHSAAPTPAPRSRWSTTPARCSRATASRPTIAPPGTRTGTSATSSIRCAPTAAAICRASIRRWSRSTRRTAWRC